MSPRSRSIQPRKQRAGMLNAPLHLRHRLMAAPLQPSLRESQHVRSLPVVKGDTVVVERGDFAGIEGKVSEVDPVNFRIYVEGVTREKADGSSAQVPVHPSKVLIKSLKLDDEWRKTVLTRSGGKAPAKRKPEKGRVRKRARRASKPSGAK